MQFQYNSDYPTTQQPASAPLEFPPADPHPCARLTTRVYHPLKGDVSTVHNVLVRTMRPVSILRRNDDDDDDDDNNYNGDYSMQSSSSDDDDDDDNDSIVEPSAGPEEEQRAYWMQRTIREAIYGRVLYAVVLKKRQQRGGADWEVTTEQCAIKEMSWQHIRKQRDKLAEDPIKEVSAMQFLKGWHEKNTATSDMSSLNVMLQTNIMMPLDLLSDDRHLYSVMPFCDGGELFDRLDFNERFSEEEAKYWLYQVLNGIESMQRAGICHRDLSLENLLVHQNGCLVIDLGMCLRIPYVEHNDGPNQKSLADTMDQMSLTYHQNGGTKGHHHTPQCERLLMKPQGTCGKWIYMSPEIYNNKDDFDGFAVDMWAAGVILFLMLTGFPPWERACSTDDRFRYMTAGYLVQMLTEWDLGLSSDGMDLLQRMLWLDPKDRLSLAQVRAHPWMVNTAVATMPSSHSGV